ncbi:MAG: NFACT family protein, partial [Bacillota bacterium]|nr:NFACT family protein [Bacillota bacterium]
MPLDGLFLNKLLAELRPILTRAKINRVHQPDKHTITLKLNQNGIGNFNLVLSSHPQNARINVTTLGKENPQSPPLFAMVLRKHIEGGRIISVSQKGLDRVAEITVEGRNEIGEPALKKIFVEIMGKHSNTILTENNLEIIGAIKQYGENLSGYREVLPHCPYISPPPQNKADPFFISEEKLTEALLAQDTDKEAAKALCDAIEGISPQTAGEIVFRCRLENYRVDDLGAYEYRKIYETLKDFTIAEPQGSIVITGSKAKDFYFFPLTYYKGEIDSYKSLSETLEEFFDRREQEAVFTSRKAAYSKTLNQAKDKLKRKIAKQEKELATAVNGDKYKLYAELLTAYLYQIPSHGQEVTLPNFYEEEKPVSIKLLPELSPSENAARYFHRYNKAKTAKDAIVTHLGANKEELIYLENLCYSLESAEDPKDLEVVREEAISAGYIRDKGNNKGKKKKVADALPPYQCEYEGYTILIGRNNKQNDKLTLKT